MSALRSASQIFAALVWAFVAAIAHINPRTSTVTERSNLLIKPVLGGKRTDGSHQLDTV